MGGSPPTRCDAVTASEELRRVIPVICSTISKLQFPFPWTRKARSPAKPSPWGIRVVTTLAAPIRTRRWTPLAETGAGYVAMHMQGTRKPCKATPL